MTSQLVRLTNLFRRFSNTHSWRAAKSKKTGCLHAVVKNSLRFWGQREGGKWSWQL